MIENLKNARARADGMLSAEVFVILNAHAHGGETASHWKRLLEAHNAREAAHDAYINALCGPEISEAQP